MTSRELIEALEGKRIESARLLPSAEVLRSGDRGEHLELVLEGGFTIQLPYRDAVMWAADEAAS